ncbi:MULTISPECIES: T6SS effector BTH_I2691 family protein [unclassified Pseudoxanthomonas]|uniref:T6SS effector BTH_I2691 family protein n=1 Tax=unclassified Pseudoxanthomonas TaxID=2645906 RepID=UPI003077829C
MADTFVLNSVIDEATAVPTSRCRACERVGMPVLPLRTAYAPPVGATHAPKSGSAATPFNLPMRDDALRTLRTGYIYVLLDRRVWHAYAVTPEGLLRQFDPDDSVVAMPVPLTPQCVSADHDIPAAFLNLDTSKYQEAWIAFASDPWPRSVRDAYRLGQAPAERFVKVNLQTARDSPSDHGLALTPASLQIDQDVLEYAEATAGDFVSVHGFHSRKSRCAATAQFVENAMRQHQLPQGVLALVLDDPVGRVQEYNAVRLGWVEARQRWAEEPERRYQAWTSQALLAIKAQLNPHLADAATHSFEPTTGDGPPMFRDPEEERQAEIDRKTHNANQKLEARYHEAARAKFQDEYDARCNTYQSLIDAAAATYCAHMRSAAFLRIVNHDYDGAQARSGAAYAQMLSHCLAGGITDAPDRLDGPTAQLWKELLNSKIGPVYQALLLRHPSLLDGLLLSFDARGETDWNDADKLYGAVSKALGSDVGQQALREPVKEAIAQLLLAVSGAAARLDTQLSYGVHRAIQRVHSGTLLLCERVHMTQIHVQLRVDQYYALLCDTLQRPQAQVAKAARPVRSLLTSGLLSLAAANATDLIPVTLWVKGNAEELRKTLNADVAQATQEMAQQWPEVRGDVRKALAGLTVQIGTLEPAARKLLQGAQLTTQQADALVRKSLTATRGGVGNLSFLMAAGGVYFQSNALKKNIQELEKTLGPQRSEVVQAVWGASVGVLGGTIEGVGIAWEAGAKGVQTVSRVSTATTGAITLGKRIAIGGGVISAVAGVFDATRAWSAAGRTWKAGDKNSAALYGIASGLSLSGAFFGAAAGSTVLLGPLGIAILLSLSAYSFAQWAKSEESNPFERWARRCCFGKHDESPPVAWDQLRGMPIAIGALNAAVLGVDAVIQFDRQLEAMPTYMGGGIGGPPHVHYLRYHMVLPPLDEQQGSYRWALAVTRYNGTQMLVGGGNTGVVPVQPFRGRTPDYDLMTLQPEITRQTDGPLLVSGNIKLESSGLGGHDITAAALHLTYWPNRSEQDAFGELTVMEVP